MRSNDVTANGLADVVGLPRCPLNATRTLRMIENPTLTSQSGVLLSMQGRILSIKQHFQ